MLQLNKPINSPGLCKLLIAPSSAIEVFYTTTGNAVVIILDDDAIHQLYYTVLEPAQQSKIVESGENHEINIELSFPGQYEILPFIKQYLQEDRILIYYDQSGSIYIAGSNEAALRLQADFSHNRTKKSWSLRFSGTTNRPIELAEQVS